VEKIGKLTIFANVGHGNIPVTTYKFHHSKLMYLEGFNIFVGLGYIWSQLHNTSTT